MHPTDKAARIAGAVYLSMVVTAPFSLIYVPGKLLCAGMPPRRPTTSWLTRPSSVLASSLT